MDRHLPVSSANECFWGALHGFQWCCEKEAKYETTVNIQVATLLFLFWLTHNFHLKEAWCKGQFNTKEGYHPFISFFSHQDTVKVITGAIKKLQNWVVSIYVVIAWTRMIKLNLLLDIILLSKKFESEEINTSTCILSTDHAISLLKCIIIYLMKTLSQGIKIFYNKFTFIARSANESTDSRTIASVMIIASPTVKDFGIHRRMANKATKNKHTHMDTRIISISAK